MPRTGWQIWVVVREGLMKNINSNLSHKEKVDVDIYRTLQEQNLKSIDPKFKHQTSSLYPGHNPHVIRSHLGLSSRESCVAGWKICTVSGH